MDQRRDPGDLDHFMDQVEELESKVDIMQASIRKTKEQYQKKANGNYDIIFSKYYFPIINMRH